MGYLRFRERTANSRTSTLKNNRDLVDRRRPAGQGSLSRVVILRHLPCKRYRRGPPSPGHAGVRVEHGVPMLPVRRRPRRSKERQTAVPSPKAALRGKPE
jgi:hypothetical protein